MHLALFDLDYTLLPIDSDHAWLSFLCEIGVVDASSFQRENDRFFAQYKAGTLDIFQYLEFALAPLAAHPREQLDAWHRQFMQTKILPNIYPSARALVDQHRGRGDLCCVVTATNHFVTAPIARAFGLDQIIAIDLEERDGRFTGRPLGMPSFREGKVIRVGQWLSSQGKSWDSFEDSHFYSDSLNDLPLLEKVRSPVATNPDDRLEALARQRGWPVLRLTP